MRTGEGLCELGPADLDAVRVLVDQDPVGNVFVGYRLDATNLEPRLLGGRMWGFLRAGRLVSACHAAANLVPVNGTAEALDCFADEAVRVGVTCASIVGRQSDVARMWSRMSPTWGPARSERTVQPLLRIDGSPKVRPDPDVHPVLIDETMQLYPASVAMYTEEVGVSPEAEGASYYRSRVAQLVVQGWAFARFEAGEVVFKAEIGAATRDVCQIQGVWVRPDRRGQGLAAAGMAAVVELAQATVAPVVSLYVNEHNEPALRAYARVGFTQVGTFATILF